MACDIVPAFTFGLPSLSPPIQLPICTKGGKVVFFAREFLIGNAVPSSVSNSSNKAGNSRRKVMR